MTGRSVARIERAKRDAAILESLAQGRTQREAAERHGVSKTTVQRVLSTMQETLPEQTVARDLMMSRFATYRAHLWPLLEQDPVRTVPRLLEVDQLEARTRGLMDPQQGNGTAEVQGMLAMLIGRPAGGTA
ncbi:helix-turn-helix domain-containing protein [Brachybacterium vulturis]|uniref:helix-turn-helix domain-containing protein n=1 Tax=Brachybacterium vulturis TaxID=2017484 RepID=UPI001FED1D02|nr:helix-turn-helix domain-containing protein [Brachybacterium vulturis]